MDCQAVVGVLREAGLEVRDRPVLPSALGLPDGARTRLLVDHDGLFRVYCAENLASTLPVAKIKGALKAAGDEALLLMVRGGGRLVALHTTAEGEVAQAELGEAEVTRLLPTVRAEGGEDPYEVSERIRELILHPEDERKAYQNKGLFSDDYLKHRLTDPGQYPEWREDVSQARENLRGLYGSKKEHLGGLNEAQTENEFLDEALEVLGHTFVKQTKTKDGSRPDYTLFGDAGTKDAALRVQGDPTKLYASSLAVAEGKYWGRNLDVYTKRNDKDNEATVGQKSSPEMQIARYLQETGLSWGILTNGSEWRLYHAGAPGMTKRHYSVDLVRALESEDLEDFRRFYLFFRSDAFVPKGVEGKSFLDRVNEGSEEYAVRVSNNLKKVIFERLFVLLAAGFLEYQGGEIDLSVDEEVLKKTYRGTLALLYRLLFLLYAEARDLLPHRDRLGYGVHSITRLKRDVAASLDEGERFSDRSYVMWERLDSLFRIVDGGSPELSVPPYNGGLFKDVDSHDFLGTHRVSDRHLAPALDQLSRQEIEGGERRFVDYGFVGVRELGSVYEGLLEFSLKIADEDLMIVKEKGKEIYVPKGEQKKRKVLGNVKKGDPYLANDRKERKATGAYYTPRYIVDYIVRSTLAPLVEERREALETQLLRIAGDDISLERGQNSKEYRVVREREAGALRTLLDVKVLDPAMGSGHFLVAAVDYLTDEFSRIISELDAEPVVEELADLRTEIRDSLEAYGASATDEQLSDANLLKRMVLKRCVYGVDLNEMAVELAKLSLWLDAFTVGAPLSFLDHHLKYGNSLIGSSVREVREEVETSGSLLGNQFTATLMRGTELMQHVGEIPDVTEGEVRESIDAYTRANRVLAPYKRMMDIWASQHFGNRGAERFLSITSSTGAVEQLTGGHYDHFAGDEKRIIDAATNLADAERFFHWELEFPEVFYQGARERENAGFDAVFGNPPYVRQEALGATKAYFAVAYPETYHGAADLYVYFYQRGLQQLRRGGRMSNIVTNKWLRAGYGEPLRSYFAREAILEEIVDFGHAQIFPGADVFPCIVVLRKAKQYGDGANDVVRVAEFPREALGKVEIERYVEEHSHTAPRIRFGKTAWSLEPQAVEDLMAKIRERGVPLTEFADLQAYRGVTTGLNEAFLIDTSTRERLIREDSRSAEIIKPYLRGQDIKRWSPDWQGLWMIFARRGIDIDAYPAIKQHLLRFRERLEPRPQNWGGASTTSLIAGEPVEASFLKGPW